VLARHDVRRSLGRLARRLADRWAPQTIRVEPEGGGWKIYAHGVLIARVSPGLVRGQRTDA
jgi:hypothetical protein